MSSTFSLSKPRHIDRLYDVLCQLGKSTFAELQRLTRFKDTDLCLAICSLLQAGQIEQFRMENQVYYAIAAR